MERSRGLWGRDGKKGRLRLRARRKRRRRVRARRRKERILGSRKIEACPDKLGSRRLGHRGLSGGNDDVVKVLE